MLCRDDDSITPLKPTHDGLDLFPHRRTFGLAHLLKEWAHFREGIPSVLHPCGKRREPLGTSNNFYCHLTEAGSLEGASKHSRITQREHPRIFERRRRQSSVPTSNCQWLTDMWELLCGRKDDGGESSARFQRTSYSGHRFCPLGDEHERQPANSGIKEFGLQFKQAGVHYARLYVCKALATGSLIQVSEHTVGDVRGQNEAVGTRAPRRYKRLLPRPSCDVQHAMAWFEAGEIKHSFGDGPQISTPFGAALPCFGSYSRTVCTSIM
jgi:hypothetical protein